ncbi:MAG: T9SS type A sorting domain-containing protein [Sphingobacteriales bacterium]|nr:MAG: T9SS type A sorting domain-containing protein [Sphingobacteriales bacterium]
MKKSFFIFSTILALGGSGLKVNAQISQGGMPLSIRNTGAINNIPVSRYTSPDWEAFLASEKTLTQEQKFTRPFIVALSAAADFGFPQSGQLEVTDNGYRIWRGVISVENAPAIGLAFDQYALPKGVQLFVTNENKKQIAGAFDAANNDPSGYFIIDAIQGSKVFVELNIAPGVTIDDIKLHIDKAVVFHRAIEHLQTYLIAGESTLDQIDAQLNGLSSVCMINAICATGDYVANPRKATVQTLSIGAGGQAGLCSGTLVNNAGNTAGGTCKPYITTASHCELTGETNNSSAKFAQLLVRFNFERPDCAGTGATNGLSMTGVNLIARSAFQSGWEQNIGNIKGDFMLYELKNAIPASYGAVLSGWKRQDADVQTTPGAGKKIYGFHHPVGDNKKMSSSASTISYAWPSQVPSATGARWGVQITEGYASPGSSGSGLFDGDGYLIGIASIAGQVGNIPANCNNAAAGGTAQGPPMNAVMYQKISNAWAYNENGIAGSNNLKPFLDPANAGIAKINSVNATTCTALTSGGGTDGAVTINRVDEQLDANVSVFPNPSKDGNIQLQFNLKEAIDMQVTVLDVAGRVVYKTQLKNARNGVKNLDLNHVANGLYVVKITTASGFAGKKPQITIELNIHHCHWA